MTSLANDTGYALSGAEAGTQAAAAQSWGRYATTVALRISALVVLPALFWTGNVAIIL